MSPSAFSNVTFDPARQVTPATTKATKGQRPSHQGGYVFKVDDMERARRFLIIGSEESFYQSGAQLSMENAQTLRKLAKSDRALDLLDLIVDISVHGRAAKQGPGLFALAVLISQSEDQTIKNAGYLALPKVARTASTLFEFLGYLEQFQNITGMGVRKAIARWYNEQDVDQIAYQMVKYRQRGVYNHRRMLRISKGVKDDNSRPQLKNLLRWQVGKSTEFSTLPKVVKGFEYAKDMEIEEIPDVIRDFGLTWEMIPTERLNDKAVWDALLSSGNVPLGALLRQLPRLTNLGIIAPMGDGLTAEIIKRLTDPEALKKARIHPVKLLDSMAVYKSGRGTSQTWTPVTAIVDALEDAFYASFDFVETTNKRMMLALDLSGSMTWPQNSIRGMRLKPREVSACMAMVTARSEPQHLITGYSAVRSGTGFYGWTPAISVLDISPKSRLSDVIKEIESHPAGGTDLSLPMEAAISNNIPVDVFVSYTDNENGYGRRHPFQALQAYRDHSGIDAKMVVVGMSATKFTIADPKDKGMLDIAGFDSAVPQLIADFSK